MLLPHRHGEAPESAGIQVLVQATQIGQDLDGTDVVGDAFLQCSQMVLADPGDFHTPVCVQLQPDDTRSQRCC